MENKIEETRRRPRILITNDDGINAKGLHRLASFIADMGEVRVVAPDAARSGQSGAVSIGVPLRITLREQTDEATFYSCNGTPVDCVKLALHCFKDFYPDLILSGINHGHNAAVSILYSGTMGAVLEGCVVGIPSIGFSLCSHDADADFEPSREIVREIVRRVLNAGLPPRVCLNVNIPVMPVQGVQVCRQAHGHWTEEYDTRCDADGKESYWLSGYFINKEPGARDTDEYWLSQGYVTIVPCTHDQTAYSHLTAVRQLLDL